MTKEIVLYAVLILAVLVIVLSPWIAGKLADRFMRRYK